MIGIDNEPPIPLLRATVRPPPSYLNGCHPCEE